MYLLGKRVNFKENIEMNKLMCVYGNIEFLMMRNREKSNEWKEYTHECVQLRTDQKQIEKKELCIHSYGCKTEWEKENQYRNQLESIKFSRSDKKKFWKKAEEERKL